MRKTLLAITTVLLMFIAAIAMGAMGIFAYADSATDSVWAVNKSNISYPNKTDGLDYTVYCSALATKLTYSYSNDLSEKESGELALEVNPNNAEQKIGKINIKRNGEYTFTATIYHKDGNYDVTSDTLTIDDIDMNAPKLKDQKAIWGVEGIYYKDCYSIDGGWHYTYTATDSIATQDFTSKYSGVGKICVFYVDVTKKDEEIVKDGKIIGNGADIVYNESFKNMESEVDFSFDVIAQGAYFVYMEDRAGNCSNAEFLFIHYPDAKYYVSFDGISVDITSQMEKADDLIQKGTNTYKESLLDSLEAALYALRTGYDKELGDDEIKSLYNTFSEAYKDVINAEQNFEVRIINGELLSGTVTLTNFDASNFDGVLLGETVVAEITIAEITNKLRFPKEVLELSSIDNPDKIVKISYKLTKNGELIMPNTLISIKIVWDDVVENTEIVSVVNGKYYLEDVQGGVSGTRWTTFHSTLATKEFYAVVVESEQSATDSLLWLWILIGVLGGLIVAGVLVYFLYLRPKLKNKTKNSHIQTSMANEPDSQSPFALDDDKNTNKEV